MDKIVLAGDWVRNVIPGASQFVAGFANLHNTDRTIDAQFQIARDEIESRERIVRAQLEQNRNLRLVELALKAGLGWGQLALCIATTTISVVTQRQTAKKQLAQQARLAEIARLEREGEREERRRITAEEQAHRWELARQQATDALARVTHERNEWLRGQQELTNLTLYPIAEGPGHLYRSLRQAYPNPDSMPLLLLLSPSADDDGAGTPWAGLSRRIEIELQHYQRQKLIRPWAADKPFRWPHHTLFSEDLAGIRTIVMGTMIARERLEITIGGCHLDLGSGEAIQDSCGVQSLVFPEPTVWSPALVQRLNETSAVHEAFALPGPGADPRQLARLNHELAARAAALCAVATMDAHYLLTTPGYDEQLDHAMDAVAIIGGDWPIDNGLPLWRLADPAFHLLHRARRHLHRGNVAGAKLETTLALSVLAGHETLPLDAGTAQLAREAVQSGLAFDHHLRLAREVLATIAEEGGQSAEVERALRELVAAKPRTRVIGRYQPEDNALI